MPRAIDTRTGPRPAVCRTDQMASASTSAPNSSSTARPSLLGGTNG